MTTDRAIEILNPEHREHYDGMEEVNEACRMGMEAMERARWIPCSERLPESDEIWQKYIVVYRYNFNSMLGGMCERPIVTVANYCHKQKIWTMDTGEVVNALIGPDNLPPQTSRITHWQPLPEPPEKGGNGEDNDPV